MRSSNRRASVTANRLRPLLLLASSSVGALLIGAGAPAQAACTNGVGGGIVITGPFASFSIPHGQTDGCLSLNGATIRGNVVNAGTITPGTPTGILVTNSSTLIGSLSNSGTISVGGRGIYVDPNDNLLLGDITNSGTISAQAGIIVSSVARFGSNTPGGGIVNTGTISAVATGIAVNNANAFLGGITNSGTISTGPAGSGIVVSNVTQFGNASLGGGITNSGAISAGVVGIAANNISTFIGGISNAGTISAQSSGITVQSVTTFIGGITNSGTISLSALNGRGILVQDVTDFAGGVSNSGVISAKSTGILVSTVSTFTGGISNSGTITNPRLGLYAFDVSIFLGGVSNAGTISAQQSGVTVQTITTFAGGITNSGTISAGNNGILVSNISAFSGGISNAGTIIARTGIFIGNAVTFAAGSAIANSGTIIGTNAAIDVSAATSPVTIDQTGGLISGAIKLSSNADVLNVSGGTINGTITSAGTTSTLNQSGGLVVLSGTNTIGTATITGGTFQIGDESHTTTLTLTGSTTLNVDGGTLEGHGTLIGNAVIGNGATLMPGGSIGTLTIDGNLTMSSGSIYVAEFAATQASKTQINGTATLGGANVSAIITANQFGPHTGGTYTILTATTPLGAGNVFNPTVSFGGLTSAEKLALAGTASLSYDANDVFLTVPNYTILLTAPSSPLNAQNLVGGINSFLLAGGTLPAGFQNLANLSGNGLGNALNQLAGQSQGSFGPVGFEAGNQFLNLMLNPYIDGRSDVATSSPPLAYAPQQSSAPAASAFSAVALGPRPFFEPRLSFWASAYGGDGRVSGSAFTGAASTNSQIYGVATGVDYLALPNTIFGLALGGGGTAWQLGQGMGNGRSDMFQAGLYGRSQLGPAYVAGAFAYSLHDVTTNRNVTLAGFDSLQGNFSADVLSMRLEGGYRLPYGAVAVTPYGAVQSQDMFLPAYSEFATSGSPQFALNYTNRTFTATRIEIGAWFDSDALMANGIKLYSRFAWAHDFDNEGAATAFFQSLPGSNFLINSSKPARDGALATVGFEYRLADGWSVLGKFDGEFSSTTAIFAGTGTIRKVW